jgi:hypothetical protein
MHLALGAGKDENLYVINRDSMGKFDPSANNVYQELDGVMPGGVFAAPASFKDRLYFGPVGSPLLQFTIGNAKVSTTATAQSPEIYTYPGTSPSVSANGSASGIIWAIEDSAPAVLHAYDENLTELYNSNQAANGRDQFGPGFSGALNKFQTPTIANGKVFVGVKDGVAVFGLLPPD